MDSPPSTNVVHLEPAAIRMRRCAQPVPLSSAMEMVTSALSRFQPDGALIAIVYAPAGGSGACVGCCVGSAVGACVGCCVGSGSRCLCGLLGWLDGRHFGGLLRRFSRRLLGWLDSWFFRRLLNGFFRFFLRRGFGKTLGTRLQRRGDCADNRQQQHGQRADQQHPLEKARGSGSFRFIVVIIVDGHLLGRFAGFGMTRAEQGFQLKGRQLSLRQICSKASASSSRLRARNASVCARILVAQGELFG